MRFVDEAKIFVKAGDGGKGCVSFRREKFVPRGGPNGGDGGNGGDVIIRASANHRTLLDLKYNQHHKAQRGGHGEGSDRTGKKGEDLEVLVPVGTVVRDAEKSEIIDDLSEDGQYCIAAKGGMGGKGNAHFKSATNRAPRYAQNGVPGEERWIKLELKLLADVGIIGFPNVGKSTLISRISAAKPKIADYPFTTLAPILGVVELNEHKSFVIADIPGLIEGAHLGSGLGIQFLRHIERTSLLVHIIDISRQGCNSALQDFEIINSELVSFSPAMIEKPQIVAISKIDLTETRKILSQNVEEFEKKGIKIFPFSAATGEGIRELISAVAIELTKREDTNSNGN
ncbi:MAG: GTPase ObgE [Syntrophales bacterium]|jgi:GTP-binding protein|nr:GTPase ObgE [Syntrophales bacterium]